jgi:hypothetical protein
MSAWIAWSAPKRVAFVLLLLVPLWAAVAWALARG